MREMREAFEAETRRAGPEAAVGPGGVNASEIFRSHLAEMVDDLAARAAAGGSRYGDWDQDKYDEVRRRRREHRARLAEGAKVCAADGQHEWGEISREGGWCDHCGGDGLQRGEGYGSAWDDCSRCEGLGHTPTTYSRRCERCGHGETRSS